MEITYVPLAFVFVVAAAFWHYVYETILAPTLRKGLKYEGYALRDDLRSMCIANRGAFDNEVFSCLEIIIDRAIARVDSCNVFALLQARDAVNENPELLQLVITRQELIKNCANPAASVLVRRCGRIYRHALAVNCGGWLLYLVPIFVGVFCHGRIKNLCNRYMCISDNDIVRARNTHRSHVNLAGV